MTTNEPEPLVDGPIVRPYVDAVPNGWEPDYSAMIAADRARAPYGLRGMVVYDRLPRCKDLCHTCRLHGWHKS